MKSFENSALADIDTCYEMRCAIRAIIDGQSGVTAFTVLCGVLGEIGAYVSPDKRQAFKDRVSEYIEKYFESADEVHHG